MSGVIITTPLSNCKTDIPAFEFNLSIATHSEIRFLNEQLERLIGDRDV